MMSVSDMEVAPCSQTQLAFPDLTKAQSAVQRVFAVLDRKSEIDPSAEGAAHLCVYIAALVSAACLQGRSWPPA